MDDVTNGINNVGKDLKDQKFDLRVSYGELVALRALAQNPHPDYMVIPESEKVFSTIFKEIKLITNQAEERWASKSGGIDL